MVKNKFSLSDKKILLLGGNGLIGSAIRNLFYENGGQIVVIDKKKSKKSKKSILFKEYVCDVSNLKKIETVLKKLSKIGFVPDIYINCTYPKTKNWTKTNFKQIQYKFLKENTEIHLNSHIWLAKVIGDVMKKNKIKGSIIQLASIYGFLGQDVSIYKNTEIQESLVYPVIKGGIINSVRSMAAYYGKNKIRVNSISPGGVFDEHSKKFLKNYINKTPLQRMCSPEEVAYAALFLGSDASSYITGTNLIVDGGFSII